MATQVDAAENPLRDNNNIDIETGGPNAKNANRRHTRSCFQWWSILPITYKFFIILIIFSVLFISILYLQKFIKHINVDPETQNQNGTSKLIPPNPEIPQPPSASVLHLFRNGAVCSDAEVCSQIGKTILEKYQNAADAAIATLFCNGLVTMQSSGVGGGFFANIYKYNDRKAYSLDAKEVAPLNVKEEMFKTEKDTMKGPLSIAVPGEVKGYWELYHRYGGSIPWKEIIEPSIKLCETGFPMSKHMSDYVDPEYLNTTHYKNLYNNQTGERLREGDMVYPQKTLCDTYKTLAETDGNQFYNGNLADLIVDDLRDLGSIITKQDLQNYKTKWYESLAVDLNNNTVYVTPPPSGGVITAFILNILKGYNFTADSIATEEKKVLTYHRMIEAYKYAFGKRTLVADPEFNSLQELVRNLTSREYAESVRHKIDDTRTFQDPKHYGAQFDVLNDHGTSHLSVIAPNGDAISITASINNYFGSGLVGKRTGIIFNNDMNDFSIPRFKNQFGLPASLANRLQPSKRALSSMSPTIITDKDKNVRMVIGAAGGTKIASAVATVIARVLWFKQDIKEAVDAPRLHHQLIPQYLEYEYGHTQPVISGLEKLGHITSRYTQRGSIVCAIVKNATGIFANADFRKAGVVVGL